MVSRGVIPPKKKQRKKFDLSPLQLALPQMMTLKPPNPTKLFAPPSPINITTTARYHKQFTPTRNLSRQTSSADLSPVQNNSPHLHIDTLQFFPDFLGEGWGEGTMKSYTQFLPNFLTACDNK